MSTAAAEKAAAAPDLRVPPEERFWKRYSPHGEAPLSLAGSVGLHLAVGGGLLLMGMFLLTEFTKDRVKLPVEPVRLAGGGGSGGKPGVVGAGGSDKVGGEEQAPAEAVEADKPLVKDDLPKQAELTPAEVKQVEARFDPADARPILVNESGKTFARLDDSLRKALAKPIATGGPNPGRGGGTGGGEGTGDGPGKGSGAGDGKTALNDREKRMLRWHMGFTATTGVQYLAQLRDLGAILAFPTPAGEYKVVRDVRPGGKLLDEPLGEIKRIYWIDDKPRSVIDVIAALGANLPPPPRMIAFMPEGLEKQLYQMERAYVEKTLRQKFVEDKIDETHFRVVFKQGKFRPELVSVTMR